MNVIKTAIEIDVFEEMKLDETTGEIVMRPMAEMMDAPLDYIDEEDEPEWTSLLEVLNEHLIEPYTVPNSLEVPDKKDYHMIVAASEDLLKVARDFEKKVNDLHTIELKEHEERVTRFEQGTLWSEAEEDKFANL